LDLVIALSGGSSESSAPSGIFSSAEDALKRRMTKSKKFLDDPRHRVKLLLLSHLTMSSPATPSARPGIGTILYPGGVAFRVWAPFASSAFAGGTFNEWSDTANPFASEGNGYWSVDVPGEKIGDEYQFVIHNADQVLWHKNPYASEVVNSSGNAIIHDPEFDWAGDDFVMPPRNELVIYEMHVGSFNDSPSAGPGTFDEIVPKLGYLRDLGINGRIENESIKREANR
jgi:1,4-alpha-glucan branching enzyme